MSMSLPRSTVDRCPTITLEKKMRERKKARERERKKEKKKEKEKGKERKRTAIAGMTFAPF